jgi:hypothetical protein
MPLDVSPDGIGIFFYQVFVNPEQSLLLSGRIRVIFPVFGVARQKQSGKKENIEKVFCHIQ